jgi:hypothetical protein
MLSDRRIDAKSAEADHAVPRRPTMVSAPLSRETPWTVSMRGLSLCAVTSSLLRVRPPIVTLSLSSSCEASSSFCLVVSLPTAARISSEAVGP